MASGGPTKEVNIGGRDFTCTGDAAPNVKLGGVENEHLPNGDGRTSRNIKTPICWKISSQAIQLDTGNKDHEFLEDVQRGDDVDITITYMDGEVYVGMGNIEGELNAEPGSASATIELAGPGKLKRL